MRSAENRALALAVRYGRVGYVFFKNGKPRDWALSCKAYKSNANTAAQTGCWIAKFDPDVVIIEDPDAARRKGRNTKSRLRAMLRVAEKSPALIAKTPRKQRHKNAYAEAQALAEQFPELAEKLPVRHFYDTEPRNLVYFEAIALAQSAGFVGRA